MKKKRESTRKDLTGKKFNRLTAIDINEKVSEEKGYIFWNFKCDCGNITVVRGSRVSCGRTKSCGCLNKELIKKRCVLPNGEATLNQLFYEYEYNARLKKYEFNITKDQFRDIISKNCHYCDKEPEEKRLRKNSTPLLANGIDRINSDLGYDTYNVVPCCKMCNYMKNKWTEREFLDHIERIYNNGICKGYISK